MNCATHHDVAAVAFCRTCGKPLCANCTRDVRGVIYCESCLAARLEGTVPPQTTYQPIVDPGQGGRVPPAGPNSALAGVLAGFFPFGVGAVYCGQYAKGLAHLVIFTLLVWGASTAHGGTEPIFGLGIAFFYVYQIIDAVRSARALQVGQPAPDPFGLARTFGSGERVDTNKVPVAAFVLIGLGVLFLLHTLDVWEFSTELFVPIFLIALGGWLFARRWGIVGACSGCTCDRCRARGLMGPAVLITIGVLMLLDHLTVRGDFSRTWPLLLVVIGLVKILQSNASTSGHIGLPPSDAGMPPTGMTTGEVPPPVGEVKNG